MNYSLSELSNSIRILSVDAIEKAKSGHPGMALGFADVMTVLACKFLCFNPNDPQWFNRDRLVLSAGHGSMLLYSFFYLTGYKNFSLSQIESFRQMGSLAAGHPESSLYYGIETTTGPLGQGVANAVGMAIAAKKYQAMLGKKICNYKIYAIVGDGCMMEGVTQEALSLAAHLKLDNLVLLFDDNSISIDGSTSLSTSEDHIAKLAVNGWKASRADGHDCDAINAALDAVQHSDKPSIIAFKTIIGKHTKSRENSEKSHGSPLGNEEISYLKQKLSFEDKPFDLPSEMLAQWRRVWERNLESYNHWQERYDILPKRDKDYIEPAVLRVPSIFAPSSAAEATRVSSGIIIEEYMRINPKLVIGSADLRSSNGLANNLYSPIVADDFSGNFLHYGIREHAMGGIMNGLALSGFSVIGGTFLVFSDYMRPAIRLAAIMGLPCIFVMTHDSIGVGEDGATHQPVEHLASLRAMPNINVFRPMDFTETQECYELAAKNTHIPSVLVLSRQNLPQLRTYFENMNNIYGQNERKNFSSRGAYILSREGAESKGYIAIFATGSEVSIALETKGVLLQNYGLDSRIISVPCMEIALRQGDEYLRELKGDAILTAAIEAACEFGWSKIIGQDGVFFGVNQFGHSAPAGDLYKYFRLTPAYIASDLGRMLGQSDTHRGGLF